VVGCVLLVALYGAIEVSAQAAEAHLGAPRLVATRLEELLAAQPCSWLSLL
jgi:hypothetical protein